MSSWKGSTDLGSEYEVAFQASGPLKAWMKSGDNRCCGQTLSWPKSRLPCIPFMNEIYCMLITFPHWLNINASCSFWQETVAVVLLWYHSSGKIPENKLKESSFGAGLARGTPEIANIYRQAKCVAQAVVELESWSSLGWPWRRTTGRPLRNSGKPFSASKGWRSAPPTLVTVEVGSCWPWLAILSGGWRNTSKSPLRNCKIRE